MIDPSSCNASSADRRVLEDTSPGAATPGDRELLGRYATERSEAAFAELVRRHLDLVYATALRGLAGDTHLAEDVAQTVFTDLARKATSLTSRASIAGWLYLGAHHAAAQAVRGEQRRRAREQEAHIMHEILSSTEPAADWERLRPVLDETLRKLSDPDREAVLLRFFEQRPFAEIGAALEVGEDAARMRVERALDKLHGLLAQRGVTSTAAALGVLFANQAVAVAPAGLAASVTNAALAGSATIGGGAMVAGKILTFMSTTKLMVGVTGIIAIAATAITWQQREENAGLRGEMAALQQQQTSVVASLRAENERLVTERKSQEDAATAEHLELVQLRAARDAFRQRQTATARGQATPAASEAVASASALKLGMVSIDALQDVGRDTPRAAAQTMMAAAQRGDTDAAASCLTFDPAERAKLEAFLATMPEDQRVKFRTPEQLMAAVISGSPKPIAGVKLLDEKRPDADTAVQEVQIQYQSGEMRQDEVKFHREADGWKQVVSPTTVDRVIGYFQGKK